MIGHSIERQYLVKEARQVLAGAGLVFIFLDFLFDLSLLLGYF
jgi:hypothetical protein